MNTETPIFSERNVREELDAFRELRVFVKPLYDFHKRIGPEVGREKVRNDRVIKEFHLPPSGCRVLQLHLDDCNAPRVGIEEEPVRLAPPHPIEADGFELKPGGGNVEIAKLLRQGILRPKLVDFAGTPSPPRTLLPIDEGGNGRRVASPFEYPGRGKVSRGK